MLIQLPNGQWVNPECVKRVTAYSKISISQIYGEGIDEPICEGSCLVEFIEGGKITIVTKDPTKTRDAIAEQVNTALYEWRKKC